MRALSSARAPLTAPGRARRIAPFAAAGVLALTLAVLPPGAQRPGATLAAVALTLVIMLAAVAFPWRLLPPSAQAAVPIAYFGVVALLRIGGGGAGSGFSPLVLLPVFWLALHGTRAQLAVAIAGVTAVLVTPIVLVGAPEYPEGEWARAALLVVISAIIGGTVQRLVLDRERQAAEARGRARELTDSEAWSRAIVEASAAAFVAADHRGIGIEWNRAAERTFGWSRSEIVGRPLSGTLVPKRMAGSYAEELDRAGRDASRLLGARSELVAAHRDGRELPVEVTIATVRRKGETVFTAFLHDISARRRAEQRARGQHAVARALADAAGPGEVFQAVLPELGAELGCAHGCLWRPEGGGDVLAPTELWAGGASPPPGAPGDARAAQRVWKTGRVEWVPAPERGAEWRSSITLPVTAAGRSLAVLQFLSAEPAEPDSELLPTLTSIGAQIGEYLERARAELELRAETDALASVARATHVLVATQDSAGVRQAACRAALEVAGAARAELWERHPEQDALVVTSACTPGAEGAETPLDGRLSSPAAAFRSGRAVFVSGSPSAYYHPVKTRDWPLAVLAVRWREHVAELRARLERVMGLLASETALAMERSDLLARLETLSLTYELTGLPNRRALDDELRRALARTERTPERPLCVAMVDLDRFKLYNDRYGHQAGDRLLHDAAHAWPRTLRATDLLARYGGEEFALVMPDCGIEDAVRLLERVRAVTPAGQTCSAGVARWDGAEPPDGLIARADAALYDAKRSGRDRVATAAVGDAVGPTPQR